MFWKTNSPEELRENMVRNLIAAGSLKSPIVIKAFREVPRHKFLAGFLSAREAYADRPVMLKYPVSSASQPQVMAYMLETLVLASGMTILEIGTASGYNAALIAHITGDPGLVFTIEYESDLAQRAMRIFEEQNLEGINLFIGDGTRGWPEDRLFHRIIVTAEVRRFSGHLLGQIREGGFLVAPYSFFKLATLIVKVGRNQNLKGEVFPFPVSFVPLRGEHELKKEESSDWMGRAWDALSLEYGRFSSPALWGLFLSFLMDWLMGEKEKKPEYYRRRWHERGKPSCFEFSLRFTPRGNLAGVTLKGE